VAGALLDQPLAITPPRIEVKNRLAILTNGKLRVEVSDQGQLQFFNAAKGEVLLEEPKKTFGHIPPAILRHSAVSYIIWRPPSPQNPESVSTAWASISMVF